jgi:hypothetical protein
VVCVRLQFFLLLLRACLVSSPIVSDVWILIRSIKYSLIIKLII